MSDLARAVTDVIRTVPDFPKPGIQFKDITPVLARPDLLDGIVHWMADRFEAPAVQTVVGMESRGFLFGPSVAVRLDAGFAPARKPGKLPWTKRSVSYSLEYGEATLELHVDAVTGGVVIVDDLLATGGTAQAAIELVRQLGGSVIGCAFLVELDFLAGRERLGVPVHSLVHY